MNKIFAQKEATEKAKCGQPLRRWLLPITLWLLPVGLPYLIASDIPLEHWPIRLVIISFIVLVVQLGETRTYRERLWWATPVLLGVSVFLYGVLGVQQAAWLIVIGWFSLILLLFRRLSPTPFRQRVAGTFWNLSLLIGLALIAGFGLAIYALVSLDFAEEEFFTLVTGFYLGVVWFLVTAGYQIAFKETRTAPIWGRYPKILLLSYASGGLLLVGVLGYGMVGRYQASFFPAAGPLYPGISEQAPFLCEEIDRSSALVPPEVITDQLVRVLSSIPEPDILTLGSLAVYTKNSAYAQAFRDRLLQEAQSDLYTFAAHSVKGTQSEAALRAYQFGLVSQAFPDLFSQEDWQILEKWFAGINQRAMTIEWADWLYATAFNKRPEGPYNNQEIGTGLLAILEKNSLAAAGLSQQNQAYLTVAPLGWNQLFRNTDDAYVYQATWLANAWWLYDYQRTTGQVSAEAERNIRLSLLWLLLQAIPDGAPLSYNLDSTPSLVEFYMAGASRLKEPDLAWLAARSLDWLENRENKFLSGGFTADSSELPAGETPAIGSCLMFGDSGLPTRKGPLAPDKIVLRDGWAKNSTYILANLRFSGWHRYKATGTLARIYQGGSLATEKWTGDDFRWLPKGRSAFRDKRVPRENLNGLLLPKSGLSKVMWVLSGLGGPWMQNPPAYAEVDQFFTSKVIDGAKIVVSDWDGWRHERTLYLLHEGLVLVVDQAASSTGAGPAAIIWHLNGSGEVDMRGGLRLDNEQRPARVTWSQNAEKWMMIKPEPSSGVFMRDPDWEVLYTSPDAGQLNLATAFLTGERSEGDTKLTFTEDVRGLHAFWQNNRERVSLLHNRSGNYLESAELGTDGTLAVLVERKEGNQDDLCYTRSQKLRVTLTRVPQEVFTETGRPVPDNIRWQLKGRELMMEFNEPSSGCLILHQAG